jgi:hypothetical protein
VLCVVVKRETNFETKVEYFLVHRFVEKSEQQYLWNRTKEIRSKFLSLASLNNFIY